MVDEIDQNRDARDCKKRTKCNGQMRHEDGLLRAPNRAHHEQTIEEGSDKCAKHDLIAAIAHEVAQDPGPELGGGKLEGQNLTMRMQMRRFTRLTNAFSKKFENHMHMVAIYTVWYNYVKQHKSLKGLSPAMAAGISDTLWSMTDLAVTIDATLPKPTKRGPYRKASG
jgi:hypothetical protein